MEWKEARYKKIKEIVSGFQFFINSPNHGFDLLQTAQKLDDYFDSLLSQQRQELIKKVEGMKKPHTIKKTMGELSYMEETPKDYGYNQSLSDIINLLKEENG